LQLRGLRGWLPLLNYWADANPTRYLRLVDPKERGHPLTVLAVVYLLLSIVVCFGNIYAWLYLRNPEAFVVPKGTTPNLWHFLYFSALTTGTVAFGDLVPKSVGVRLLVALHVGTAMVTVVGLVASTVAGQTARIAARYPTRFVSPDQEPHVIQSGSSTGGPDPNPVNTSVNTEELSCAHSVQSNAFALPLETLVRLRWAIVPIPISDPNRIERMSVKEDSATREGFAVDRKADGNRSIPRIPEACLPIFTLMAYFCLRSKFHSNRLQWLSCAKAIETDRSNLSRSRTLENVGFLHTNPLIRVQT
jgi:hypothetical protein